jgi:neurobeachin-like protein 1/2
MRAGSRDTTLIIWDIIDASRGGGRLRRSGPPGASLQLQQAPRHVLHGHEDAVACLALSPELDLIVSAAADGTLLFHTLGTGRWDSR